MFQDDVRIELEVARDNYPAINSLHEGYAILKEEVDEFWEEVRNKPAARDEDDLYTELVQIAAMAQRIAEDVVLRDEDGETVPLTLEERVAALEAGRGAVEEFRHTKWE